MTCFLTCYIRKDTRFNLSRLIEALKQGSLTVLNVAAICASAGMIVGVVSLTGLGLKLSTIIIQYAGGSVFLTTLYTGFLLWIIGLAVPITATYIIAAVIAAPALVQLGVPDYAAHMFIFYYALLSEVSSPTALSPFAAAAITGGDPFKTTLMAWKYCIPAFLMPFIFTVIPEGRVLLLHWEGVGVVNGVWILFASFVGIGMLASGASGYFLRKSNVLERTIMIIGALGFIYPHSIGHALGFVCLVLAIFLQKYLKKQGGPVPAVS